MVGRGGTLALLIVIGSGLQVPPPDLVRGGPPAVRPAAAGAEPRRGPAAGASDDDTWSTLTIPGGLSRLFDVLGLPPPADRASALLAVARALYVGSEGDTPLDGRPAALDAYLRPPTRLAVALAAFPSGVSLDDLARGAGEVRGDELLELVGVRLAEGDGRAVVVRRDDAEAESRRGALARAGVEVDGFERALNAGGPVRVHVPAEEVPLPLTPAFWLETVLETRVPAEALAHAILTDRQALWFYYGLVALDGATRRFLSDQRDLVRWIVRERSPLFAAFGRSLRVRDGRVVLPGAAEDQALWEDLVGVTAADPGSFIRGLLGRDNGRLLWFYDVIAHLDPGRQAVAFARSRAWSERREAVRALYTVFADFDGSWNPQRRPFTRRPADPGLALILLEPDAVPTTAGSTWTRAEAEALWARVWEEALSGLDLPPQPPAALAAATTGGAPGPARLVARIVDGGPEACRAQLDMVLFGQRVLRDAGPAQAFETLLALRGFRRFPALMLALERAGVRSVAAYAAAARRAEQLSAGGSHLERATRLAAFQGSLGLLQYALDSGVVAAGDTSALAASLVQVPLAADGWYRGGITRWLDEEFLPALKLPGTEGVAAGPGGAATARDAPGVVETRVIRALSGTGADREGTVPTVEWEGHLYAVDPGRASFTRRLRVRSRQRGNTLDDAVALWRLAASLAEGGFDVDHSDRAAGVLAALQPLPPCTLFGRKGPDLEEVRTRTLRTFARGPSARGASAAREMAAPLLRLADTVTAEAIVSLIYALAIEDPDALLLLGDNPALRHDLGLSGHAGEQAKRLAWTLPAKAPLGSGPWHVVGSLLAVERPLAEFAVRPTAGEPPEHPPTLNSNDARVLAETAVLQNASALADADRDRLAAGIRAGRAQLSHAASDPAALDQILAGLPIDEWRRALIPWSLRAAHGRPEGLFSLWELFLLGTRSAHAAPGARETLHAWGSAAQPRDGSLALRLPLDSAWSDLAGRPSTGLLGSQVVDLQLRVAEWLSDYRLPARLARGVFAGAASDLLARTRLTDDDDWLGLSREAQGLTRERFEDHVSALTAGGPLIPIERRE